MRKTRTESANDINLGATRPRNDSRRTLPASEWPATRPESSDSIQTSFRATPEFLCPPTAAELRSAGRTSASAPTRTGYSNSESALSDIDDDERDVILLGRGSRLPVEYLREEFVR